MKVQEDRKQATPVKRPPLKSEPIRGHEQSTSTTGRNSPEPSTTGRNSPARGVADEEGGGPKEGGVGEHNRGAGDNGEEMVDDKGRKASRAKGHEVTETEGHEMGTHGAAEANNVLDARNGGGVERMGPERGGFPGKEVVVGGGLGRIVHVGDVGREAAGGKDRQVMGTAASSAVTALTETRKRAKSSSSSSSAGAGVTSPSTARTAPTAGQTSTATTTTATRRRVSPASIHSDVKHSSQDVTSVATDGGFFISNTAV
jgi:hypothetical protein